MRTEYLVICSSYNRAHELMNELLMLLYVDKGFKVRVISGPRPILDILDNDTLVRFVDEDDFESIRAFRGTVIHETAIIKYLEDQKK